MENQAHAMLNELATRLVNDEAFRQQLLEQPEIALADAGFSPETLELDTTDVEGYARCARTCKITCDITLNTNEPTTY